MTVNTETIQYVGFWVSFCQIIGGISEPTSLVCSERNKCLSVQIVISEKGKHYSRICSPPNRATYIDGIILINMLNFSFISRKLFIFSLLRGKFNEVIVRHVIIFVGYDLKLVGTRQFTDGISHTFGVAHLDIPYTVILARMGEKYNERLSIFFHITICF